MEAMDPQRLNERATSRAWGETKVFSTNTLGSIIWLAICGGVGSWVANELDANDGLVTNVMGPAVGIVVGIGIVLLVRLLFALRAQSNEFRNEIRRLTGAGSETEFSGKRGDTYVFQEGSNPTFHLGSEAEEASEV